MGTSTPQQWSRRAPHKYASRQRVMALEKTRPLPMKRAVWCHVATNWVVQAEAESQNSTGSGIAGYRPVTSSQQPPRSIAPSLSRLAPSTTKLRGTARSAAPAAASSGHIICPQGSPPPLSRFRRAESRRTV
eukprot:scaffold126913_cov41-Tisochrysis_lutea.AAC.2